MPGLSVQGRQFRNFSCPELSFYQFHHYPQTDNIDTMIEHLYHHSLQTTYVSEKMRCTHQADMCNGRIGHQSFQIILPDSDQRSIDHPDHMPADVTISPH